MVRLAASRFCGGTHHVSKQSISSRRSAFLASRHPGPAPDSGRHGGFRSGSANGKQFPRSAMATVHAGRRNSRGCECPFDPDRSRGNNHDTLLPANNAVRVLQPIGNYDFDVAIKIDSPITATDPGTSRGLMVLADSQDFITFALVTDGTNISLTARTVTAGVATTVFNQASFNEYHNPICLRLSRTGTAYTAYYSPDGVVWIQAASFVDAGVPTLIGPFASNYNDTPARAVAVVMAINWFDIL